jgi:hypothetical protein
VKSSARSSWCPDLSNLPDAFWRGEGGEVIF